MTQEQEELLKMVREAGPSGLYVGNGSRWNSVAFALEEAGICEWRTVARTGTTTRSVSDTRFCTWTDYYLIEKEPR